MGSYLVIGMGRFGSAVATELYRLKNEVLAVEADEVNAAEYTDKVTDVVIGDAKDAGVLKSLDVQSFDSVIVAMAGDIEDSILTTLTLIDLGAKNIICKAQDARHARILALLGANKIIHPEHDMGIRLASSLSKENFIDYLEISPEYGVIDINAPEHWIGKSIAESNLRRKYGVTIIAIKSANTQKVKFSPSADTIIHHGDKLTIIGSRDELNAVITIK